jgi:dTDP-4-dehydrorhamnose 3,5-epimerase
MKAKNLGIEGLWLLTFPIHTDNRGFFREWFKASEIERELGRKFETMQANISSSDKGVLRGIHFSLGLEGQGKLVTCVSGAIWDVVVDLRKDSPTFRHWVGTSLDSKKGEVLFISEGLGHGFQSLEDNSAVTYLLTSPYSPGVEHELNPFDPELGISWPIEKSILSEKDKLASSLQSLNDAGLLP